MKLVALIILITIISCNNSYTNLRPPIETSSLNERHSDSDFNEQDLIGTWKLSSQSEWKIKNWQNRAPGWSGWQSLFRTIEFLNDGTVYAEPNLNIENLDSTYKSTNKVFGKWTIDKDSVGDYYYEGLLATNVVNMIFEYPKRHIKGEHLYIMRREGIVLWTYIGDPDSSIFAEFTKEKE